MAVVLAQVHAPLYRNALVLMGNTAISAVLGFVFWTLAARLYPPAEVGLASAGISAALFVATLAQLGLPYAMVRFAPSAQADRGTLFSTVVLTVALASAATGGVFVAGMGVWAPTLGDLAPFLLLAGAVIALGGLTGASTALLYAAVADRDARPALAGGLTHGTVKAALVAVLGVLFARVGFSVLLAWLFGTAAAVAVQVWLLRARLAPRVALRVLRLGAFLRYSAGNWAGDLLWASPGLLFPLLVVALLGAEANAYFIVAWSVASLLLGIPTAVASSLLAEGSHDDSGAREHLRRALGLTVPLVLGAILAVWVGGPLILEIFGAAYAAEGVETLRLLTLASLPLSIDMLFLTVARVDRDIRRILTITAATGVGSLALAVMLATPLGEVGVALGFLVAHATVAVVLCGEWMLRRGSAS